MRERTAGLMKSLLVALIRVLLPSQGRHRAAPPQPPVVEQQLAAPPRPRHVCPICPICPCQRERILQRRRAHWNAAYGIDAELRRRAGREVSV